MNKKRLLGYGFKLKEETITQAVKAYGADGFYKNIEEAKQDIALGKKNKVIPEHARPKIFKIYVENV